MNKNKKPNFKNQNLKRRAFCKNSALGLGALALNGLAAPLFAHTNSIANDHFLFHIHFNGGIDPSYLFDARPLEMTKREIILNYLGTEPSLWTGNNGQTCWASSLCNELLPFKDDFSIVNGVVVSVDFDGHDQGSNIVFTGNPFGGDSYLPLLNRHSSYESTHLDGLLSGFVFGTFTNHENIIPMTGNIGHQMVQTVKQTSPMDLKNPAYAQALNRFQSLSQGEGRLSLSNKNFTRSYPSIPSLMEDLKTLTVSQGGTENLTHKLQFMKTLIAKRLIRSILWTPSTLNLDTHAYQDAQAQPTAYSEIVSTLVTLLKFLKSTAFDGQRSLFDVTTLVITSEFGRTLRQSYLPFSLSGTDHNALTNSVLVAGKGIRGGLVLGESDYQSHDEKLSTHHLQFDPKSEKIMGRPFDFKTMTSKPPSLGEFNLEDYLTMANVINTLLEGFGVPKDHQWKINRFADPAPILTPLLKI